MEIFLAAVIAWAVAQLWKVIAKLVRERKLDLRLIYASGGMPSSHTSFVVATTTKAGLIEGFNSSLFAICVVFSIVIMYDAAGVRQSVGIQAKLLNQLIDNYSQTQHLDVAKVKEILGHTPFQVIVGMAVGVAVGLLV